MIKLRIALSSTIWDSFRLSYPAEKCDNSSCSQAPVLAALTSSGRSQAKVPCFRGDLAGGRTALGGNELPALGRSEQPWLPPVVAVTLVARLGEGEREGLNASGVEGKAREEEEGAFEAEERWGSDADGEMVRGAEVGMPSWVGNSLLTIRYDE